MNASHGNPFGYSERETLMAYVVGYFDESGKFKDHDIICFAGFLADPYAWERFTAEWSRWLRHHGLRVFKSAKALRFASPLSPTFEAKGIEARTTAINKYIDEIQEHLEFGVACAVDARAFRALPEKDRKRLGDPQHVAFRCVIGEIGAHLDANDTVSLTCDDEEKYSVECYKIYTGIRKEDHRIRRRFISVGFGDDFHFPQLQAADLFAGLLRRAGEARFLKKSFPMQPLFDGLLNTPATSRLKVRAHFYAADELRELAKIMQS